MWRNKDTQAFILIIAPPQPIGEEFTILLVAAMQRVLALLNDVDIPGKLPDFLKLFAEFTLRIPADNPHADCWEYNEKGAVSQAGDS